MITCICVDLVKLQYVNFSKFSSFFILVMGKLAPRNQFNYFPRFRCIWLAQRLLQSWKVLFTGLLSHFAFLGFPPSGLRSGNQVFISLFPCTVCVALGGFFMIISRFYLWYNYLYNSWSSEFFFHDSPVAMIGWKPRARIFSGGPSPAWKAYPTTEHGGLSNKPILADGLRSPGQSAAADAMIKH